MSSDLIPVLKASLGLNLPENISLAEIKEKISSYVNELIQKDFGRLVSILYRIDISEPKLKSLLKENPGEDAGKMIADLIIERQLQKIRSRQEYRKDENVSDDEKW